MRLTNKYHFKGLLCAIVCTHILYVAYSQNSSQYLNSVLQMIEVRFLTLHNSQVTGQNSGSSMFVSSLSSSPFFFHCTTVTLKPSKHLPLTTFNQLDCISRKALHLLFHTISVFNKTVLSIRSCVIISVISALGDSVIHINQKYKKMILDLYINNSVHSYSWFLLNGSFLCSVILFEVW